MRVTIYIEGGGRNNKLGTIFKRAWRDFFASAGFGGRLPSIVAGGSRNNTFERFLLAVKEAGPDDLPILLVDSEGPVQPGQSAWEHLQATDGWRRPADADGNSAFLMVQAMEAWLLADRDALREYFGRGFNESRLPGRNDPEQISIEELELSLRAASANCNRQYDKGAVSFEILGRVNAGTVESRCSRAKALFDYFRAL